MTQETHRGQQEIIKKQLMRGVAYLSATNHWLQTLSDPVTTDTFKLAESEYQDEGVINLRRMSGSDLSPNRHGSHPEQFIVKPDGQYIVVEFRNRHFETICVAREIGTVQLGTTNLDVPIIFKSRNIGGVEHGDNFFSYSRISLGSLTTRNPSTFTQDEQHALRTLTNIVDCIFHNEEVDLAQELQAKLAR